MPLPPEAIEMWSPYSLTRSADGWRAVRQWSVNGVTTAGQAIGMVPVVEGATHPESGRLRCRSIGVAERPSVDYWIIRAEYGERQGGGGTDNVLAEPTRILWRKGAEMKPRYRDADDNPILTSTRTEPRQPPTRTSVTRILTLIYNSPFYDITTDIRYEATCNKDQVRIPGVGLLLPGQMAFVGVEPEGHYRSDAEYVPVGLTFELRGGRPQPDEDGLYDGFKLEIPDVSYQGFRPASGGEGGDGAVAVLGNFLTKSGQRVTEPVMLDGKGRPKDKTITVDGKQPVGLATPAGAVLQPGEQGVVLKYKQYKPVPYAPLVANLPQAARA